jgi:hypothetical protein
LKSSDLVPISGPPLFQRENPLETIQESGGEEIKKTSISKLSQITANERALAVYHEHHRTCRKGYMGRCGCRLAKPSGICNGTHCVLLEAEKQPIGPVEQAQDSEERMKKKTMKEKYAYKVIDPIVLVDHSQYCLRNPLQRRDRDIIYWELDRPLANLGELNIHVDLNIVKGSAGDLERDLIRTKVKRNLRKMLKF